MNPDRDGIIYVISSWCAKLELQQSDVLDLVYRVLVEAGISPTYSGIPRLKEEIAKIYSETLGYKYDISS